MNDDDRLTTTLLLPWRRSEVLVSAAVSEPLTGIHRDGHVDPSSLSSDDDKGMLVSEVGVAAEVDGGLSFFTCTE